jgi:hypothetical protein
VPLKKKSEGLQLFRKNPSKHIGDICFMERNLAEYDLDAPSALLRQVIVQELEKEPEMIDSDFVDFLVRGLYAQEQSALPQVSLGQIAAVTHSIRAKDARREQRTVSRKLRKFGRWSSVACAAVAIFIFANVMLMQLSGTCLIGQAGFTSFCDSIDSLASHHSAEVYTDDSRFGEKTDITEREGAGHGNFKYSYS